MRAAARPGLWLALLLPLACSDGSGPRPVPTSIRLSETGVVLSDGDTLRLTATVLDQEGRPLESLPDGTALAWASSDPGVATVALGRVTAERPGRARVTVTAGAATASAEVTVAPVPTALQAASQAAPQGVVGAALTDSVAVRVVDRHGAGVPGVAVTFEVADGEGTLSARNAATGPDGVARTVWRLGERSGGQRLAASASGLAGSPLLFLATARSAAPARLLLVGGDRQAAPAGGTLRETLAVRVVDGFGNGVPGAGVTWTVTAGGGSVAPAGPTTDSAGVARAAWTVGNPGENSLAVLAGDLPPLRLTATSDGEGVVLPVITSITPALLTPGATAVITGEHFGAAEQATVTVAGVAARVTRATPTQLTVTLPERGALPCEPTRAVPVTVRVGGVSGTRGHPLRVAVDRVLARGESVTVLAADEVGCSSLGRAGGRYLLSVVNQSRSALGVAQLQLRGAAAGDATSTRLPAFGRSAAPRQPLQGGVSPFGEPQGGAHADWLRENRELRRRLGPAPLPRGGGARLSRSGAAPAVGELIGFRVPAPGVGGLCGGPTEVTARVVYVGPRAVVLEDTLAPLRAQMDSMYQAVGEEYDRTMHDLVVANFGDPLAVDARTNGDGRLFMLFTRAVNRSFPSALAFVFAGDLYPRGECAASNQAEVFYARVPTLATRGFAGDTRDNWLRTVRPTVIHEVKHLASYAERLRGGAAELEETWLEEATARVSEELWARTRFGYRQRGNTGYRASVYCEVRPSVAECAGQPVTMYDHFAGLAGYHRGAGWRSPLGSAEAGDYSFYGSGWSLVRWAVDQSAQGESAFLRALTRETRLTGAANLEARTGRGLASLLADWSLASAVDDLPGFTPARPELAFPSWNTRDVFAGLQRDFPASFSAPFPVATRAVAYGAFTTDVAEVRGGAATLFELSGTPAGEQVVELIGAGGAPLPPALRLAIVRVE